MVANPILSLSNLVIGYNEPLVEPISLEVGEGEVIAILGVSGIGKTTLLRTIAGLVPPIKGSYRLKVDKKGGDKGPKWLKSFLHTLSRNLA